MMIEYVSMSCEVLFFFTIDKGAAGLRTVEGTTTVGYNHKAGVQAFMVRAPFFRLFQKLIHLSITALCTLQYETTNWEM